MCSYIESHAFFHPPFLNLLLDIICDGSKQRKEIIMKPLHKTITRLHLIRCKLFFFRSSHFSSQKNSEKGIKEKQR